jgi:hypothetical protein
MWVMRLHIYLDDVLVKELDEEVGARERSAFIEETVRNELDRRRRWRLIWRAVDSSPMTEEGHPWDPDPAAYFHEARRRSAAERDAKHGKLWGDGR